MRFKLYTLAALACSILVLFQGAAFAQLTVGDPTMYGTKPAYIDNAKIVVEPHGAFTEQTMYLMYADHDAYPGDNNLEIVQRFTLPEGAVIDNLWLWIGDTLVQAQMFPTWTARQIYDSIVVRKHDPAFLAKNGSTYELHIYPLISGQSRRTRINYIVPTQWLGDTGIAQLPYAMLNGNNAQTKPVQVVFKEKENVWGTPSIHELPLLASKPVLDSAGYRYYEFDIPDITPLPSLSLEFHAAFNNGLFASTSYRGGDSSYFQIGINPASLNVTRSDTGAMSVIVGLDLGGNTNNNVSTLVPKIEAVLHHALRPKDRFRLVVAGDNAVNDVSGWRQGDSVSIDTVLSNFGASALADSISKEKKPKIVFCDKHAQEIWDYPSLSNVAVVDTFDNIVDAAGSFSTADIVASYDHGFETSTLTDENLSMLFPRIDSLFARGGRFLGYFDHNRPPGDSIEPHYIRGLTENYPAATQTLYAQPNGNIGNQFPPSILLNSVNYLTYDDPSAKAELANGNGQPVVVSKHVGNGLLVVSGVWAFEDDGALKQTMAIPLLGVSQFKQGRQLLEPLLNHIGTEINQTTVNEVFVFSNADSVVSKNDASTWVTNFLAGITGSKPVFQTINLLDGSTYVPPYISENGVEYYGAGYLTYLLSQSTSGLHFEAHLKSWDLISGGLTYSYLAKMDSLNVSVSADGGAGKLIGMREVDPEPNEPAKPRFFIGVSNALQKVTFDVTASFQGSTETAQMQDTSYISIDTTRKVPIIAEMLGSEELNDLFNASSYDTSAIVNLAMKYNLLSDYTALIALEPNTSQPASNGNNNGNGGNTAVKQTKQLPRTVVFSAYPNPFNPTTTFYFSLRAPSHITIVIYNVLGEVVRTLTLSSGEGITTIVWDGRDAEGRRVASGVYFARAIIVESPTHTTVQRSVKLLMLK